MQIPTPIREAPQQLVRAAGRAVDAPRTRSVFNAAAALLLFFFIKQWFWPSPAGVFVQGAVIGGLTALIAFGIALIYRANRIVNFAQGDLGGAPAALAVLLIAGAGWPYFPALVAGIVAAIVLGILVETLIIRRFFKAPRLILTVATIGLAQVLTGLEIFLPRLFDLRIPPQQFPSPFDFSFEIHPIVFRGNDIIAMLAVPAAIIGLAFFFRYTNIGIAIRASAESADRAFLLGIPVKRIHTVVWVLASLLASLALFMRAGIIGLPIGQVLGPAILLRALAAAVIGRMEKLPTIFIAAVALGIIEQSIVWHTGRSLLVDPILFVVVIAAFLFQRRSALSRAEEAQTSTWQAAKEVRPIPRQLARLPEVRWGVRGVSLVLAGFLIALPALISESRLNLAGVILIFGIVGVSLVVLTGWAGQVSLGQVAFVGIGAAVSGALTSKYHWDLSFAILAAGLAGAAAAMIIGLPALRIRGLFLAVTTLSFALATSSYLLNREFFGNVLPLDRIQRGHVFGRISVESETRYYYLVLIGLFAAMAAVRGIRRSRTGRVLIATRENERAVQAFGISAVGAKLIAFAFSGFLAAYAGALFVHHQQSLGISPFAPEESLRAFTMVVIGGLGSVPGALIGAAYLRGITYFIPSSLRFLSFLTSGVGVLLILMLVPGGLGGVMYQIRDSALRLIARRRRILVPSLVADAASAEATLREGSLAVPGIFGTTLPEADADREENGASEKRTASSTRSRKTKV